MTIQSDPSKDLPESGVRNRRTQRRIGVRIPIQLVVPGLSEPITAMNQDISWSGAQFITSYPGSELSGRLCLLYPWKSGHRISVEAEVVRAERLDTGHWQVSVRFASLSPRSQSRLERLLRMLDAPERPPDSESADLFSGLEVRIDDLTAMREVLEQVAGGSLTVVVLETYDTQQSLRLVIRGTDEMPAIRLRARVLEVARVETEMFPLGRLFSLKLGFEHPPTALKGIVDRLIGPLQAASRDAEASSAGAGDWLRDLHFATPIGERRAIRRQDGAPLSVLESRYRDSLKALEAVWGDPDAFDACLLDLRLASETGSGGWPEDALDELRLLQSVHAAVYGAPSRAEGVAHRSRHL